MARGRTPGDPAKKQHRNPTLPMTELESAGVKAPRLPGDRRRYAAATRAWYQVWCESPQAAQFLPTDWQRLHMLALLVDAYYRANNDPDTRRKLLAEIRLNEKELGATAEARLRLRWRLRENEREDERAAAAAVPEPSRRRKDPRLTLVQGAGA